MEQVLHNFYTQNEMDRIWKELEYLRSTDFGWRSPNPITNAVDEKTGITKFQGAKQFDFSLVFDKYQHHLATSKSNIYSLGKKLLKWMDYLENKHEIYFMLKQINYHTAFVNYYNQDKSVYNSHKDLAVFTILSYFYKKPKNFTGGDLLVEDRKYKISNGFTIILPSWMDHGTTPVTIKDKTKDDAGRYCIAHFYTVGVAREGYNGIYSKIDYGVGDGYFKLTHELFDPTPIPVKE